MQPLSPSHLPRAAQGSPPSRAWVVGAALALAVPAAGAAVLGHYRDRIEQGLGRRAQVSCRLGAVEAGLTGELVLREVALGEVLSAERITLATSWRSLWSGRLELDEVEVAAPKATITIDADGQSELARLLARLARPDGGPEGTPRTPRARTRPPIPRRIVVSEGELLVTMAGLGSLRALDVELIPRPGGVRAVAGRVHVEASWPGPAAPRAALTLELARAAADLELPSMRLRRALAVGGAGTLALGTEVVALGSVALARHEPTSPVTARLEIDDRGTPRSAELSVRLAPVPALAVRGEALPLWPLASLVAPHLQVETARFSGELAVAAGAAFGLAVTGELTEVTASHPVLAAQPVTLSPALELVASWQRHREGGAEDLRVMGSASLGAAQLAGTLEVHRGAALSAELDATLAQAPCQALLGSLPSALVRPLEGLALAGELGGRLRVEIDTAAPLGEGAALSLEHQGACRALAEPPAADVSTLGDRAEHVFPDGTRALIGPGVGAWAELRSLPAHVDGAFVAAEDARFFSHGGFDLAQIARSLEIDLREGRLARGGSTISQQLVKNELLDGQRTAARKLTEAILTWRLESRLDKRKILERYLNIIELGPKVWGLAAAAQHWFGVAPQRLSVRQAAFLAALTPEPTTMTRRLRTAGGLDRASAVRVDTVLRAMKRHGLIDQAEYEEARTAELRFRSAALR